MLSGQFSYRDDRSFESCLMTHICNVAAWCPEAIPEDLTINPGSHRDSDGYLPGVRSCRLPYLVFEFRNFSSQLA